MTRSHKSSRASFAQPFLAAAAFALLSWGLAPASAQTPPDSFESEGPGGTIQLFNGQDLSGWTHVLKNKKLKIEDVWSVKQGVLFCKGRPGGYIRTKKDYDNYVLTLEWRWDPKGKGGNNGVLVHTSTPGALGIWPKSIEIQLQHGHAGDFWVIGTNLDVENEGKRKKGRRHLNLTDDSENPLGEWNTMEITCRGGEILVKVNGTLVNHATNCTVTRGAICLQSEGTEIYFRDIELTPLKKPEKKK